MDVRPYTPTDLAWMVPIAAQYGEAEDLRAAAGRGLWGWVVPDVAAIVCHPDRCGTICSGLTARAGLRHFLRLGRTVKDVLHQVPGVVLHSHMEPGTWQDKLYRQLGFVRNGTVLWWRA